MFYCEVLTFWSVWRAPTMPSTPPMSSMMILALFTRVENSAYGPFASSVWWLSVLHTSLSINTYHKYILHIRKGWRIKWSKPLESLPFQMFKYLKFAPSEVMKSGFRSNGYGAQNWNRTCCEIIWNYLR